VSSVKLKLVTKRFRDITAVNKMNIEIKDGEFFVLLGPTGAGKTTTLRLVSGLETPDEGDILIDDIKVNDWAPASRDVAFVFQYYSLYPNYTVYQNLEFPLTSSIRFVPKEERDKKVKEVARILHIDHLLDRKSTKLSGGEMQRVTIGRAIIRSPRVFLMDEPLSNLDAKLREEMRVELKRMQIDMGSTIFFVTHDQIEAMTMSDRIAILDHGRILQIGTSDEIYNNPGNFFVSKFVGVPTINVFEAEISSDKYIIEKSLLEYKPNAIQEKKLSKYKDKKVHLCIRPEDIEINNGVSEEYYKCKVYIIERMGMENIITLKAGSIFFKALTPPTLDIRIGDIVNATFNREKIYFFDINTSVRIG